MLSLFNDWPDRHWFWGEQGLTARAARQLFWQEGWLAGWMQIEVSSFAVEAIVISYMILGCGLALGLWARRCCLLLWLLTSIMQTRSPLIL